MNSKIVMMLALVAFAINVGMLLERVAVAQQGPGAQGQIGKYMIVCESSSGSSLVMATGDCAIMDTSTGNVVKIVSSLSKLKGTALNQ